MKKRTYLLSALMLVTPLASAQTQTIPGYGGQVSTAQLMTQANAMSQSIMQAARQSGASAAELAQLESQLSQMNTGLAQSAANGTLQLPAKSDLAALGLGGSLGGGLGAQSLGGMNVLGGGGLDSLLSMIRVIAGFIPGAGPFVDMIAGTLATIMDTANDVQGLLAVFRNGDGLMQALLGNLGLTNDLNSLLGVKGATNLENKFSQILPAGMTPPVFAGVLDPNSIQSYADQLKRQNLQINNNMNKALLNDPMRERLGVSKYGDLGQVMATLGQVEENNRLMVQRNRIVENTTQSAEAMSATEQVAKDTQKTLEETKRSMAQVNATLPTRMTELGVARQTAALMAQNNVLEAQNGAAITASLQQMVRSQDANTMALNQLVSSEVERRSAAAAAANMEADRRLRQLETNAKNNALATQVTPAVVNATSLEGKNDLSLPRPQNRLFPGVEQDNAVRGANTSD